MIQEIQYLPDQIYFAARDGMVRSMCSLLENMSHDKVKELLGRVSFAVAICHRNRLLTTPSCTFELKYNVRFELGNGG